MHWWMLKIMERKFFKSQLPLLNPRVSVRLFCIYIISMSYLFSVESVEAQAGWTGAFGVKDGIKALVFTGANCGHRYNEDEPTIGEKFMETCLVSVNSTSIHTPDYKGCRLVDRPFGVSACMAQGYLMGGSFLTRESENLGKQCLSAGNPIHILTGNKYQQESDYIGSQKFPLAYIRTYNSTIGLWQSFATLTVGARVNETIAGNSIYINGERLGSLYHVEGYDLIPYPEGIDEVGLFFSFPDGKQVKFSRVNDVWVSSSHINIQLAEVFVNGVLSGYEVTLPSREIYRFDSDRVLASFTNANGLKHSYVYDGNIINITHSLGGNMQLTLNSKGNVTNLLTSDGKNIVYHYDSAGFLLQRVEFFSPNGSSESITYHYEDANNPHLLTGMTNKNNIRYASWGYDNEGRAIYSCHLPNSEGECDASSIDFVQLDYSFVDDRNDPRVIVSNALSKSAIYHFKNFDGLKKLTRVEGQPTDSCAASSQYSTYYNDGALKAFTDKRGYVTEILRNDRNLVGQKTTGMRWAAGIGSPLVPSSESQRIITTWKSNTALKNTEQYQYRIFDGSWQTYKTLEYHWLYDRYIDSITIRDPRAGKIQITDYSYTFHDTEQTNIATLTIDGPRTDVTDISTYQYNSLGQLTKFTNALGQETQYLDYTAGGLPQTIVDENGIITELTYNLKQLI